MPYEGYLRWLKELSLERLDKEIDKNRTNYNGAGTTRARQAWRRMLDAAETERKTRVR